MTSHPEVRGSNRRALGGLASIILGGAVAVGLGGCVSFEEELANGTITQEQYNAKKERQYAGETNLLGMGFIAGGSANNNPGMVLTGQAMTQQGNAVAGRSSQNVNVYNNPGFENRVRTQNDRMVVVRVLDLNQNGVLNVGEPYRIVDGEDKKAYLNSILMVGVRKSEYGGRVVNHKFKDPLQTVIYSESLFVDSKGKDIILFDTPLPIRPWKDVCVEKGISERVSGVRQYSIELYVEGNPNPVETRTFDVDFDHIEK